MFSSFNRAMFDARDPIAATQLSQARNLESDEIHESGGLERMMDRKNSTSKPTLMRKNAFGKNTLRNAAVAPVQGDPFRIDGDDERVTNILNTIGITKADMLGISEDAWREGMSRPTSCELHYDRHPEADPVRNSLATRTRSLAISRTQVPEQPSETLRRMSLESSLEERNNIFLQRRRLEEAPSNLSDLEARQQEDQNLDEDLDHPAAAEDVKASEDKGRSMDSQTSGVTDSTGSNSFDFMEASNTPEAELRPPPTPTRALALTTRPSLSSWKRLNLLGTGSFGAVYRAVGSDGNFFAVKEVSLSGSDEQQSSIQLQQEIALLSHCLHENIVQYIGTQRAEHMLYIFLELVTQGSLVSHYKSYPLFEDQIRNYTRQILSGLHYLHEMKVVHRDIKCANILVHADGTVKLADFGMAKELDMIQSMRSCKGSPYWMAPEVINPRKTASYPADIWSLGCTILEMATRKPPFSDLEWHTVLWRVGHGEVPKIPDDLAPDARDFITQCLQAEASNRPTAKELLEHPFVTSPPLSRQSSEPEISFEDSTPDPGNWSMMSNSMSRSDTRHTARSVRTRRSIYTNNNQQQQQQ